MNYFEELNAIDVGDKTEKKNGLTYLSWAWAWGELKKRHPKAFYTIYETADGMNYFTDGRTAWVKTGVTVPLDDEPLEHIEYLPIMDFKNASIPLERVTSFDVNKAIQRSLTKACARHGVGLYIYAGEDLPESGDGDNPPRKPTAPRTKPASKPMNEQNEAVKYAAAIKAATPVLESIVDADSATAALAAFKAIAHTEASLQEGTKIFIAKTKKLGLIYDKAKKRYVNAEEYKQEG